MIEILANKSDEFYIAMAKYGSHSFIFAGVKTKNKNHILARMGKVVYGSFTDLCGPTLGFTFSSAMAGLIDEKIYKEKDRKLPISYLAYSISPEQYVDFVDLIQRVEKEEKVEIDCYRPAEQTDTQIKLRLTAEPIELNKKVSEEAENLIGDAQKANFKNTCRHTAKSIINYVYHDAHSTDNISSQFFFGLPLKTTLIANGDELEITRGAETKRAFLVHPDREMPFYILPAPPSTNLDPVKLKVMNEMFHRLEKMLHIAPESKETQDKFALLKALYNEQIKKSDESLTSFFSNLHQWKNSHLKEIQVHRAPTFLDRFFTRQTATEKMFSHFEDYEKTGLGL
ncbi:hypothetical protein [Legionella hackeliae]|uniref:Uncharacterized protein n=1 Tax=Legionella hackeliae TaxID=449 RepID=A0A0A8ULI1_LEGHA|nr:hypothetical protein [Legionella hackeliae]KTD10224.1 hypothetical protein Lhac_2592 [Legionella hackeliae]CEK09720.1 protein of unknown function [Legionella hackeliae]STX49629.1 Uncharacterised protein [Legionella hackeliae]